MHTLQTVVRFGKHKGKTVNQILQEEPGYIDWCLKNVDTFEMSDTDKEKVSQLSAEKSQQQYEDYYGAIDLNDFYD